MRNFSFSLYSVTRALDSASVFTLGLASLSAYLKARGFAVAVKPLLLPLDQNSRKLLNTEPYKHPEYFSWLSAQHDTVEYPRPFLHAVSTATQFIELWVQAIGKHRPSAIGLSVVNKNLFASVLFVKLLKERYPDLPVILGGPACNRANARFLCAAGLADAIVIGEGEETLADLLTQLRDGRLRPTPGAFVRHGEDIIDGGPRALLDITTLPVPDFDGLRQLEGMDSVLPVAFSRGCNFPCQFCNERKFWLRFRQMTPDGAIALLRSLHARYGVSRFYLSQSLMNGDLRWLGEFAAIMRDSRLPYLWGGNIRIHPKMDTAYLRALHAGGCRVLLFGIESGSDNVLKLMRKGTTAGACRAVLRAAADLGFWTHTYWIFGFPGETEADLCQSVDFLIANLDAIGSFYIHEYNAALEPDAVHANSLVDYVRQTSIHLSPSSDYFSAHANVFRRFIKLLNEQMAKAAAGAPEIGARSFDGLTDRQGDAREAVRKRLELMKSYLEQPAGRSAIELTLAAGDSA